MNNNLMGWALVLYIVLVLLGPFFTIWALNTLFPALAIGYGIDTWFACAILAGIFKTNVNLKK